ncbi:MAG: hypothetical protein ACOYB5_00565 [Patescibacteria group bacterium]
MRQIKISIEKLQAALKDKQTIKRTLFSLIKIWLIPTIAFWFAYMADLDLLRQVTSVYTIFFLPGYFLVPVIFPKASKTEIFAMSFLVSILIVPLTGYLLALKNIAFNETTAIISLHSMLAFLAPFFFVAKILDKKDEHGSEKNHKGLFVILGIFAILMSALLGMYPFLPEADPYAFYAVTEKLLNTGIHPQIFYRPFFSFFIGYICLVGNFSIWIVMKYLLAFLPAFFLPLLWEYGKSFNPDKFMEVFFPLAVLAPPVFLLESQVVRPQIFFVSILFISLYFIHVSVREKSYSLWITMLVTSTLCVKYHELGLFLIFITIGSLPFLVQIKIRNMRSSKFYAISALLLSLLVFSAYSLYPLLIKILNTTAFFNVFSQKIMFKPWFLNNFTNVDGMNVSWNGLGTVEYYAYFLSALIPVIFFLGFREIKLKVFLKNTYAPFLIALVPFFAIAEILPRFNINLLPDRAWFFVTISTVFLLPPFLNAMSPKYFGIKKVFILLLFFSVSLAGTFYIAKAKQGYITQKEYESSLYLKNNTPSDSLIVSQENNNMVVEFFGKRKMFSYKPIFYSDNYSVTSEELTSIREAFGKSGKNRAEISSDAPIYILFSFDKNKGLYSQRDWWRYASFAGANIHALSTSPLLERVFDNESVVIWKINFK